MNDLLTTREQTELNREHDVMAAALSVMLPGAGHFYKAQYGAGLAILLIGLPFSLWMGILLSLATLGLGLLLPVAFWAMVATSAYFAEDRRKHHIANVL